MGSPSLPVSGQPLPMQPGEYVPIAPPNLVTFRTDRAEPPSTLYVQRDDVLAVSFMSSQSVNDAINITARLLRAADGVIVTIQRRFTSAGLYSENRATVSLAEGWLLGFAITPEVTITRGTCFARVWLSRGPLAAAGVITNASHLLAADYITKGGPMGWPGARIVSPVEAQGMLKGVGTSPGAAADIQVTAGSALRWRLLYFHATLVTSLNAANRLIEFAADASGAAVGPGAAAAQAASTTVRYGFFPNCANQVLPSTNVIINIPQNLLFTPGASFGTHTASIQAGDQWTLDACQVEEWLDY